MKTVAPYPPLPGQESRRSRWVVWLCGAGVVVLALIGLFAVRSMMILVGSPAPGPPGGTGPAIVVVSIRPPIDPEEVPRQSLQPEADPKRKEPEGDRRPPPGPAKARDGSGNKAPKVGGKTTPNRSSDERDPFADIKSRNKILLLPENNAADLLATKTPKRLLATLNTDEPDTCRLMLMAGVLETDGKSYRLTPNPSNEKRIRTWSVVRAPNRDGGVGDERNVETLIGTFELEQKKSKSDAGKFEQALTFGWAKGVGVAEQDVVRLMTLEIVVGHHRVTCELHKQLEFESIAIKFGRKKELGPDLSPLAARLARIDQANLFVDILPRGFPNDVEFEVLTPGEGAERVPPSKPGRLLRQIRVMDLLGRDAQRIAIVSPSGEAGMPPLVTIRLGFHSPPSASHIGLSVTWECCVVVETKSGVALGTRTGFVLKDAVRATPRLEASLVRNRRDIKSGEADVAMFKRRRFMLDMQFKMLGVDKESLRQKARIMNEFQEASRGLTNASASLLKARNSYRNALRYRGVPGSVSDEMKRLHGKATLGWRLYWQHEGRRVGIARSE